MARLTREMIRDRYMILMGETPFSDISLSDVAKSLGVSKTALFRYYRGKDDLLAAVREKTEADIATYRWEPSKKDLRAWLLSACDFLKERTDFLPYYFQTVVQLQYIDGGGSLSPLKSYSVEEKYILAVASNLLFIGAIGGMLKDKPRIDDYVDFIVGFIHTGLEIPDPGDVSWARISPEEIGKHPYLTAMDSVFRKYGIRSLSIQRIADELGIAPSSLYSTFPSLKTLISQTGMKEYHRYYALLEEKMQRANSLSDAFAVSLAVAESYFSSQVDISSYIDGIGGLLGTDYLLTEKSALGRFYEDAESLHPGLGRFLLTYPITRLILTYSHGMIPGDVMIHNIFHGIKEKKE